MEANGREKVREGRDMGVRGKDDGREKKDKEGKVSMEKMREEGQRERECEKGRRR